MSKYDNYCNRGAGTGVIPSGSAPMRRGIWDLYETTNPLIGLFERSFWIELNRDTEYLNKDVRDAALEELAHFFENNIKDNLIFLEHSNLRVMGGVSINAGTSYLRDKERKKRNIQDKYQDEYSVQGYELRMSYDDAVTFLSLWQGYKIVEQQ